MDYETREWYDEMDELLAMAKEQFDILQGEINHLNIEHKVIDKCDTLIDLLNRIKIKREDKDVIIDVKKILI